MYWPLAASGGFSFSVTAPPAGAAPALILVILGMYMHRSRDGRHAKSLEDKIEGMLLVRYQLWYLRSILAMRCHKCHIYLIIKGIRTFARTILHSSLAIIERIP